MTSSQKTARKNPAKLRKKRGKPQSGRGLTIAELVTAMEQCGNAESLNERIITPIMRALVEICDKRGYVFNIYGEHCNLAITPENHSAQLYDLINAYLDEAGLG